MGRYALALFIAAGLAVARPAASAEEPTSQPVKGQPGAVKEYVYKKTPQGKLRIHVDFPKAWKPSDRRPGIVFFFGGAWVSGTVRQFEDQASYLASRGMVAARADYRVKSRHKVTPDKCVEDANSAVRWLRAHAAELGIDPKRIVAAGGSSGGHLAACTGTAPVPPAPGEAASVSAKPNAMILFNPALSFVGSANMMRRLGPNGRGFARRISPTVNLTKDAPPALLLYGTNDFLLPQGRAFLAKAKRIGHRSELYLAEGQRHGFFNRSPWKERTLRRADEFLISLGYLTGKPTVKDGHFREARSRRRGQKGQPSRGSPERGPSPP
ncbi:hypothetical protein LCGC14_1718150 [marine sediment metagenome]|uniref:BD-FAE-like domain-containing protein n=1 Tax=marine sediment metagenome TaxID=412755 RepID=A0A0F9I0W2_9ZZZZ